MRKTLGDMARHMKTLILPETLEAYAVKPVFEELSTGENIRKGVSAFRAFLLRLCDVLMKDGDRYDNYKKIAHPYENRVTISLSYPFLNTLKYMLRNIGYYGVLTEDGEMLVAGRDVLFQKDSDAKNIECLRFLTDCGIGIDGIDLGVKRQKISDMDALTFSYPDNPAMLTGLKAMAAAEIEFDAAGARDTLDYLLRCDYRVLQKEETDAAAVLKETIRHLSADVQAFVMRLHRLHIENGLKCEAIVKDFWIKIMYSRGSKEIWGVNTSLNNGFNINVKAANTDQYAGTISTFSPILQELIAKGYGCGRKRESGRCDGGCKGLVIPLDESVLELSGDIETWFTQELACLQKKKGRA